MTAADDDYIEIGGSHRHALIEVTLDLFGGTHGGFMRVTAGFAQGSALSEQVPALIEFNFEAAQALLFLVGRDLTLLYLRPQRLFLGDQVTDMCQGVAVRGFASVGHHLSLPHVVSVSYVDSVGSYRLEARATAV